MSGAADRRTRTWSPPPRWGRSGIERAEAVVALMDALGGRLRPTAQILLSRVQGGV
jgi:hypothetical protein